MLAGEEDGTGSGRRVFSIRASRRNQRPSASSPGQGWAGKGMPLTSLEPEHASSNPLAGSRMREQTVIGHVFRGALASRLLDGSLRRDLWPAPPGWAEVRAEACCGPWEGLGRVPNAEGGVECGGVGTNCTP